MRKLLATLLILIIAGGGFWFYWAKMPNSVTLSKEQVFARQNIRSATDDHPVHITMGGHSYVIPRNYLQDYVSDDEQRSDRVTAYNSRIIAQIGLEANALSAQPLAKSLKNDFTAADYYQAMFVSIYNTEPPTRQTLNDIRVGLKQEGKAINLVPALAGLMEETTPFRKVSANGVEQKSRYFFGHINNSEIMVACSENKGLNCLMPLLDRNSSITIEFQQDDLASWQQIYQNAQQLVATFRKS